MDVTKMMKECNARRWKRTNCIQPDDNDRVTGKEKW